VQLSGVSCPASSSCQSVGTNSDTTTLAEGWNGTKWAVENTPGISGSSFATLAGVACTTASNCWAVGWSQAGTSSSPVIDRWNGKTWS
jgi:hypothetical protein